MTQDKLNEITSLTEKNNHTEANLAVASYYPYLSQYRRAFEAILTIQDIEKHLPYDLIEYRSKKHTSMLEQIERTEGEETANKIREAL